MGSTSSGNHLELVAPATGSTAATAAAAAADTATAAGSSTATAAVVAADAATAAGSSTATDAAAVAADELLSGVSKPRNVAPEHCVGGIGGCVLLFCLYAFNSMFCKEGCKTEQFSVMTCQNHEA